MSAIWTTFQFLRDHWVATLISALILYIYVDYKRSYGKMAKYGLKGPKPWPVFGNMWLIMKDMTNMHLTVQRLTKEYGKVWVLYMLKIPLIVVADPEMLKDIMVKRFWKFHSRTSSLRSGVPEPLRSMLIRLDGDQWSGVRNVLTPSFTSGKLRKMMFIMNQSCTTLEQKFKRAAEKHDSVDIGSWMRLLSLEAMISAAFGLSADTQINENDKVTAMVKKAMNPPSRLYSVLSFMPLIGSFVTRHMAISKYGFDIEDIIAVSKDIIADRKRRRDAGEETLRYDFLHLMLEAQREDRKGHILTDNEVLGQSIGFLMAGHETTSTTATLCFYHFAIFQDIQKKAQEEVDDVVGIDEELTYEHLQKMSFIEACVSETLRLYPPGYATSRLVTEDCVVKDVNFKKGVGVLIPIYTIHRDAEYFPEPDKFIPDRFMPGKKEEIDPYTYMPFGQGPRNCIGMRFALMEIKAVIASVLRRFNVKPAPELSVPLKAKAGTLLGAGEPTYLLIENRFAL